MSAGISAGIISAPATMAGIWRHILAPPVPLTSFWNHPVDPTLVMALRSPVASLLLVVTVAVSLLGLYKLPQLIERNLFRPYWLTRRQQWATLITSGFIHADVPHLLFNGFTFYAFAFGLERAIGSSSFLVLYTFGLLASSAGTWLQHRSEPGYASLGASGAISAVLFASIVYFPSASLFIMPIPVPIPAPIFAVAYLAYSHWAARHQPGGINHDAHLWGALSGLAYVALTDASAYGRAIQQFMG
jgi:membrane associated rhomboid family serine protease